MRSLPKIATYRPFVGHVSFVFTISCEDHERKKGDRECTKVSEVSFNENKDIIPMHEVFTACVGPWK